MILLIFSCCNTLFFASCLCRSISISVISLWIAFWGWNVAFVCLNSPLLDSCHEVCFATAIDCFFQNVCKISDLASYLIHSVSIVGHFNFLSSTGNLGCDSISDFFLLVRGETFVIVELILQFLNFSFWFLHFRIQFSS